MSFLHKCQRTFESISSEWSFCAGSAAGVIFAPAALLLCLFLPRSRGFWCAAGTMAVLLCRFLPSVPGEPHFETFMNNHAAAIEYEIRLDDLRLSEVPGLDQPAGVRAELLKFRFRWSGEKEKLCRGKVILYSNTPLPRRYGTLLKGTGALEVPDRESPEKRWLLFIWQLDVCLSYTSVVASLRQTSTRLFIYKTKSKLIFCNKTVAKIVGCWFAGFHQTPPQILFCHRFFLPRPSYLWRSPREYLSLQAV